MLEYEYNIVLAPAPDSDQGTGKPERAMRKGKQFPVGASVNKGYALKVEGICKHYSQTLLLDDVSFSVKQGDVLAVTGWNGSGKSTLMRIIAGLVRPSAGRVLMFAGEEVIPKEMRRRFLGMVAPALCLYDELTGVENLEFFCKVRGVPYHRSDSLALMEQVGLGGHEKKRCRDYSSGMKQRLKIVQALVHKPPLLLLDEPGSNLDSKGIKIVENVVAEQREMGITIIASNEKREVDYADRIINLSE
jgi:heme exporter protein A